MRLVVLLLYAALLGGGWQGASADEETLRALQIDEDRRTLSAAMVAALDAEPATAARAALAIGRTKRLEGAPPLRAHLAASDPSVRAMVAYGLGLLGDGASLPALSSLAETDANSAVRYAAVDALGRIASAHADLATPALAADLLAIAGTDADADVRGHAVAQLDAYRTTPGAPAIARALEQIETRDADSGVRWHAAWMLFRGYAPFADLAFLTRQTRDRDELVRVETVRALGRRKELAAIAIVRPLLRDPSWRVQLEASEALRRLALEPRTEHLKVFPPGIHLPAIAQPNPSPLPSPPAGAPVAAPDPSTFALGLPLLPRTASDMNGPLAGPHPRVLLRTTKGDVVVRLYPEWAPSTVANFLNLVHAGFFDGDRWFRIVPDFVVQTGDRTNTGDGDAGYTIPAEENPIEQRSGIIAMGLNYDANGAERDSAGTQFYLTLSPQLHLDRAFSVFGEVESGASVLANLLENATIERAVQIEDR
jgi:cyclophilin family peptidyl-prolyl cis-trans isomerase/HEAT repeat protein